jgi:hypothetical protein
MRAHYGIAAIAVILIGLGGKLFFFPPPSAEAITPADLRAGMDVLQMHKAYPNIKGLPVQEFHDMTFVFSEAD